MRLQQIFDEELSERKKRAREPAAPKRYACKPGGRLIPT